MLIERKMEKIRLSKEDQKSEKVEKGVSFVVTYDPLVKKLVIIIRRNLYLLYRTYSIKCPVR